MPRRRDLETPTDLPLPTFVIIGAQKSATRWLRENLAAHPDVFAADHEIAYFNVDAHHRCGPSWYRAHFAGWAGEPVVGEATPGYLMWHHDPALVARRMHRLIPTARLLAVLRNPVDRAYSAFVHHLSRGRIDARLDVVAYVRSRPPEADPLGVIAGGWYGELLSPFMHRFGKALQVLLHDDISGDPAAVYAGAARHIGVDPAFRPGGLHATRFANNAPADSAHRSADGSGYRPLKAIERAHLFGYFEHDLKRLESLIRRDLSAWTP